MRVLQSIEDRKKSVPREIIYGLTLTLRRAVTTGQENPRNPSRTNVRGADTRRGNARNARNCRVRWWGLYHPRTVTRGCNVQRIALYNTVQTLSGGLELLTCMVDWLSCTFPDTVTLEEVKALYSTDWQEIDRGAFGYKRQAVSGNIRLFYDGNSGMGTHVWLSGKGCRQLEASTRFIDWPTEITAIRERGGRVTRLDLAYDDRAGVLVPEAITLALDEGRTVSRFLKGRQMRERKLVDGAPTGWTEYIGSMKSAVLIRFYDKAAEQGVEGPWVRCEIQYRDERAGAAAGLLEREQYQALVGVLRGYVDFKDFPPGADSNRRRWPQAAWWYRFLQGAEKAKLMIAPKVRNLESAWKWLNNSVAPTLAMFVAIEDGDLDHIAKLANDGGQRMSAEKLRLIAEFKRAMAAAT